MISATAMFQRSERSKSLSAKQRRDREAQKERQTEREDSADLTAEEDYVPAGPAEDDYFSSPGSESGSSVAFKNVSVVTPKAERKTPSCSEAPFEYLFCHFEPETGVVEQAGCMRLHHKCLVRKVCSRSFVVQSQHPPWNCRTCLCDAVLVCRCGMGPLQFC